MATHRRCIVVKDDVWKEFKAYIMRKTKDIKKGDLSKWFEIIVNDRIRVEQQQQHATCNRHAMSKDEEMINTLTELMKEIKAYLWKDPKNPQDLSCGNVCHKKTLMTAISEIRGNDYRTRHKWISRLLEFGFISKAPNNQYKILNDGHELYDVKQEQKEQRQKEFDDTMEDLK